MALEIRLIKDNEYSAANDFFNCARSVDHVTQKNIRPFENFKWEFIHGPAGKAIYVIALDTEPNADPIIIGIQCAIPLDLVSSKGRKFKTAKGEDTLLDIKGMIKYRKRDILKEMYDFLVEECKKINIEYIWGFTDAIATFKRVGFDIAFKSSYGVLIFSPLKAFKYLVSLNSKNTGKDKIKIAGLSIVSYLLSWKRIFKEKIANEVKIVESLDNNSNLFAQSVSAHDEMFFLHQNEEYLDWRIRSNPYPVKYKSYQFMSQDDRMLAQIIFTINTKKIAFIEQTIFSNELSHRQKQSFMKEILHCIVREGAVMVRSLGFSNNEISKKEIALLKNFGFVFTDRGEYFAFRSISGKTEINPSLMYLSRLYKQGVN